ncbi:glyco protein [Massarina eburnea CBS 473.64]|uniref:Glyco protein n=1 Tax=Massarina eburnea CBS 473.64 TaxID=1395130 RepID=A0A6A6RLP9_9PLEO|nr:glyco protein [Massarina eburnea CBS 473.64]
MQFFIAASLLAATASAASPVFNVSKFAASCAPHSSLCDYSFGVVQASAGESTPVDCSAQVVSDGSLPAVTDGTCKDSSRTWTITKNDDGGFTLTVSQAVTPSTNLKGTFVAPASDISKEDTGASSQEKYIGSTDFGLASA